MSNRAYDWATCLEPLVTRSLWFSLLGLFVCRKNHTAHQGWFLWAPVRGEGQLKSQSSQRSASVCRLAVRPKEWKSYSCTPQQQGLSATEWSRVISGQCYCFPLGCCHLEGCALPRKIGLCSMGNDSAQGFWWQFLQLSPQSNQPQTLLKHL